MRYLVINNSSVKRIKNITDIFHLLDIREATREEYGYRIKPFISFIQKRGFRRDSFLEFKRYLSRRDDFSVTTKNKYLSVARIFLKEVYRRGIIPLDITQNIRNFRQIKRHKVRGFSEEEVKRIYSWINSLAVNGNNIRIKCLLTLLVFQGLRQVEIVRLNVEDISLAEKVAFVKGKGCDDKELISLHPYTVEVLRKYIEMNRIYKGALFRSNSNNSKGKRLSVRGLRQIVRKALRAAGISRGKVHGFRHYFTTRLIKIYKGNILDVARYTRHRSLNTVRIYNDEEEEISSLGKYYRAFVGLRA